MYVPLRSYLSLRECIGSAVECLIQDWRAAGQASLASLHCVLEQDKCWERADFLAVVYVVFCHFPKCVLVHIRIKGEGGAIKLV